MDTASISVNYRPIRIGWCIKPDDLDSFRKAIKLNHTFSGGVFNPIIPVYADKEFYSEDLVKTFNLDILFNVSGDKDVEKFISKFDYLKKPFTLESPYIEGDQEKISTILDIFHALRKYNDQKHKFKDDVKLHTVYWDEADPLKDVFLTTFGQYPDMSEIDEDFNNVLETELNASKIIIENNKEVQDIFPNILLPRNITQFELTDEITHWSNNSWKYPGAYIGDSQNIEDLIYYWNLKASNVKVFFYDPAYANRLDKLKDAFIVEVNKPHYSFGRDNKKAIWHKQGNESLAQGHNFFNQDTIFCTVDDVLWNGMNLIPSIKCFEGKSILGNLSSNNGNYYLSMQFPDKPFTDDVEYHTQNVVLSISPFTKRLNEGIVTFNPPFIAKINDYLGLNIYFNRYHTRAQRKGFGIIIDICSNNIELKGLEINDLVSAIFKSYGMETEVSEPGLIAKQLIKKMEDLQGCRAFKIEGVRSLIKEYGTKGEFTRSAAKQTIGNVVGGTPNFREYEGLHIEYRKKEKLSVDDVFDYLLKKDIFRIGLKLKCPSCQLSFWETIENTKSHLPCSLCGDSFNITIQLKDRDWQYKCSGLLGVRHSQLGAIPVILTLQQIDTILSSRGMIYTTATKIIFPNSKDHIKECETDLLVLTKNHQDNTEMLIGECKSNYEITDEDVEKMTKAANAFPPDEVKVFIIFSKMEAFTDDEIKRCLKAQSPEYSRVILLSNSEKHLENYYIYDEKARKDKKLDLCHSLSDLAWNTHKLYFEPLSTSLASSVPPTIT